MTEQCYYEAKGHDGPFQEAEPQPQCLPGEDPAHQNKQGTNNNASSGGIDADLNVLNNITRVSNDYNRMLEELKQLTADQIEKTNRAIARPLQIKRVLRHQYRKNKHKNFVKSVQNANAAWDRSVRLFNTTYQDTNFPETASA